MLVQIELTTRCNFKCYYCAGRSMYQGDMTYPDFKRILDEHIARYGVPESVRLQGEGEPTLHKHFFDMAAHIRELGSIPLTITNGTYKHPEHFLGHFDNIGVSMDTLDEQVAKRIGRLDLSRVIRFIKTLAKHIRITVWSVAIATDLPLVRRFCEEHGVAHVVQPLQPKFDYACNYPNLPQSGKVRKNDFWCRYIAHPLWRYYALDGTELPCCFIKDLSKYDGYEKMAAQVAEGITPEACVGCLYGQKPLARRNVV